MPPTSLQIPLTSLAPGSRNFGPVAVDDDVSQATITIDRTVPGGLNALPDTARVEIAVYESDDGGANWLFRASAGLQGGIYPRNAAGDPYVESTVTVGLNQATGRRVRATVTVSGATIAVAGSLAIA